MGLIAKLRTRPIEAAKVLAVVAFGALFAWLGRPSPTSMAVGLPLIAVGMAVRVWAAGHLRRNQELATSGPYAYLRDPLYLGRLFLLVGLGVLANNPYTYALFGIALGVFFLNYMPRKLRKETERLEEHFGQDYVAYRSAVRSLIPRLTPYPASSQRRWSFATFWSENREQWLMLAVALIAAVMILKGARLPF